MIVKTVSKSEFRRNNRTNIQTQIALYSENRQCLVLYYSSLYFPVTLRILRNLDLTLIDVVYYEVHSEETAPTNV